MVQLKSLVLAVAVMASAVTVNAEKHVIRQVNNCGRGTPKLSQNFNHLGLSGGSYTANGPFRAAIAWLDTGGCDFEAVGCGMVEMTLINGGVSSADISLISPHTYQTPIRFTYTGGCGGNANCNSANCATSQAFHKTDDYAAQRQCTSNDSGITITYC